MTECNVCAEPFNKSTRIRIECMCGFMSCRQCTKKYLLNSFEEPACMSCRVEWTRKFMTDNLDKTFMTKTFMEHRENVLYHREISMLQATQPHVEREIHLEHLKQDIQYLSKRLKEVKLEYNRVLLDKKSEKRVFIRKCPNGDCHGFLSSGFKCELCHCVACSKCREVKGFTTEEIEAHKCNQEIVSSVKLMEKDSKPCPNCSSMIYNIDGCLQMYCVECHMAFNWSTLEIETGNIDKPYYFEYQRRINNGQVPRNPEDALCGRVLDVFLVRRLTKNLKILDNTQQKELMDVLKRAIQIRESLPRRRADIAELNDNLHLRIDFMRNKLSPDEFKKKIQQRDKLKKMYHEIYNLLDMYVTCVTDLFYKMNDEVNNYAEIWQEIYALIRYTQESFTNIKTMYNFKPFYFNLTIV